MTTPNHSQTDAPRLCSDAVFAGMSPAAERLRLQVARIAPHFRTALITGEAGTGKRCVAERMHRLSPVAERPFVTLSAAEFVRNGPPNGRPGTMYLPGIDLLESGLQSGLRHVLRGLDRETRVIIGSACDLKGRVATGRLRLDLYEAIAMLEIRLLPLRERLDDVPEIARAVMGPERQIAFSDSALQRMREHAWPGNLEELAAVCAALRKDRAIEAQDLRLSHARPADLSETLRLEDVMHRHVLHVLECCAGNKLRAAELLGISRSTLYRMIDNPPALG